MSRSWYEGFGGSKGTKKCHYDTLGVEMHATQNEIKRKFRELSMKHHPDLVSNDKDGSIDAKAVQAATRKFQQITEAHAVIGNEKERRKYDLIRKSDHLWGERYHRPTSDYSDHFRRRQQQKRHNHRGPPNILPRGISMVAIGAVSFAAIAGYALSTISGDPKRTKKHHGSAVVEAWLNPETGHFEQPAPWDPKYRKLNPPLLMVPRYKVKRRTVER